jgi:hypothetical protein
MRKTIHITVFSGLLLTTAVRCTEVRRYQRARLNDYQMRLGKSEIERTDEEMHAYREGAAGGGGKTSGGCGCN